MRNTRCSPGCLAVLVALSTALSGAEAPKPSPGTLQSAQFWFSPRILRAVAGEQWLLVAELQSGGLSNLVVRVAGAGAGEARRETAALAAGRQFVELPLAPVSGSTRLTVRLNWSGGERVFENVEAKPPRRWTLYLSQHTHTDIGYTRPQTEILPESLRFIDYALDFCDLTDALPDDARFRWTCETFWAVREYLKSRPPEQIRRLKTRVREGRVEITGLMLNLSEIATESSLTASLQPLRSIREVLGAPVRLAMQNDVNGAAWCLPDYFAGVGIRYLTMGINETRSILPFSMPTAFWWESPGGSRLLAYRAEHYMLGNAWGLQAADRSKFEREMANYLHGLEGRGYAFDRAAVQFSGYFTDNSPPSMVASEFVRRWNEDHVAPRLRLATAGEFLAWVESTHGPQLPVHRQAWPDWWTDGFGSAARETAASRETHTALQVSETMLSMANLLGRTVPEEIRRRAAFAHENLMFYDEHTYGAAESISDPGAENSQVQWGEKSAYVWTAVKEVGQLREDAFGLLQDFLPRGPQPMLAVVNTLNWERPGPVQVFIDHEMVPPDRAFRVVDVASGAVLPVQALTRRAEGTYWVVHAANVPPMGYRMCRIELLEGKRTAEPEAHGDGVVETADFRLVVDAATGRIASLKDKRSGRELTDGTAAWGFGAPLYEYLTEGRDFVADRFRRATWRNVKLHPGVEGPIWKSVKVTGELEGCATNPPVHLEIRVLVPEKRVELHYAVRKLAVPGGEALYVTFPFAGEGSGLAYEAQGGVVVPGLGQIPGSASDWQTVQHFLSVRQGDGQVVWGSAAAPLVQLGGINLGKWQRDLQLARPHVYSWVMNNYWFTNFRVSQEGEFRWNYQIASLADLSSEAAARCGWGFRVPLAARVLPPLQTPETRGKAATRSVLDLTVPGLLVVDARPEGERAVRVHLREVAGKPATLEVSQLRAAGGVRRVDEVNVLGDLRQAKVRRVTIDPHGVKFLRVEVGRER